MPCCAVGESDSAPAAPAQTAQQAGTMVLVGFTCSNSEPLKGATVLDSSASESIWESRILYDRPPLLSDAKRQVRIQGKQPALVHTNMSTMF